MNFKLNKLALVASLIAGFSAKAIPTPEAVEPAFDKDDNPTYVIKYGKHKYDSLNNKLGKKKK